MVLMIIRNMGAHAGGVRRLEQHTTPSHTHTHKKNPSKRLLRKMLPARVIRRLHHHGGMYVESFSAVTILFSDIVSYTSLCVRSCVLFLFCFGCSVSGAAAAAASLTTSAPPSKQTQQNQKQNEIQGRDDGAGADRDAAEQDLLRVRPHLPRGARVQSRDVRCCV